MTKVVDQFYTYLHCKPDGSPFYVGKGSGNRAFDLRRRNPHHSNIITKYGRENIKVFVFPCDSEIEALSDEILQISQLRREGHELANQTDGGDGVSNPPDLVRKKIGSGQRGKVRPESHRMKLAAARALQVFPENYRQVISAAVRRRYSDPKERKKQSESMKLACSLPDEKERKSSASRRMWEDQSYRSKMVAIKVAVAPKGEKCSWSKITERDVVEIRSKRALGVPLATVAAEHGISQGTASEIANRKLWKHIP